MASAEEGGPRGILVVQRRGSSREREMERKEIIAFVVGELRGSTFVRTCHFRPDRRLKRSL